MEAGFRCHDCGRSLAKETTVRPTIPSLLLASFFLASPAFAEDEARLRQCVSLPHASSAHDEIGLQACRQFVSAMQDAQKRVINGDELRERLKTVHQTAR